MLPAEVGALLPQPGRLLALVPAPPPLSCCCHCSLLPRAALLVQLLVLHHTLQAH